MEFCRYEKRGHVAYVTITRPAVMNSLHPPASRELAQVWDGFAADEDAWVAVLTGEGDRAFSAGNDLKNTAEMSRLPREQRPDQSMPASGFGGLTSRFDLFKPIIARVNGFALGGGLELALACDLIIASEKARFGQPEINLGIIPGFGGTQRLPHRIGHARARELIMTGEMFDAKSGYEWGLVNKVVAPDQLMDETRKLAEKIASKSGFALRQAKAALRAAATMEEDAGLRFEQNAFGGLFGSIDKREGMKAFLEKREAKWQHK